MKDILYPLRRLHGDLHEKRLRMIKRNEYKKQFRDNTKTVFLVLTPEHGNLGDHAIAQAEIELLKNTHINFIEITDRQLHEMMIRGEIGLMNGYPILIHGGGNLGTLWMSVEILERAIIENNPNSIIVNLPNTIYYEDSVWGKEEFEKSKRIYNNHNNLFLFAREKASFLAMKDAYRNVKLVPDMVLSLNKCKEVVARHGCLLCLRNDRERTRTVEQDTTIRQQVKMLFEDNVTITDMVVLSPVPAERRNEELEKKFNQFRNSELVVTDRLHGMIFSAITGTPCIVIDSKSPKVKGCYEWIRDLEYIRFADDVSRILEEYNKIPKGRHNYDDGYLRHYYLELSEFILKEIIGEK